MNYANVGYGLPEDFDPSYFETRYSDYDHMKSLMSEIMEAMYETGDVGKLEDAFDELCDCFEMRVPARGPVIQKIEKKVEFIEAWKEFNKNYNKRLGE